MTTWLVTGGAGYIGAHVVSALLDAGYGAVAYDNLSTGKPEFVPRGAAFVEGDILDASALTEALEAHGCSGVIHCAGYKYAGESVKYPTHTYLQNVSGTAVLLDAMAATGVGALVFSSSAGVYGTPATEVVTEDTECHPESPYGESKLVAEWLIRDQAVATTDSAVPLAATSLRYFNVVGSGRSDIYDVSPHNLFPKVFATLLRGEAPRINGDDYATPDGTCVRDYVHVSDLADAHVEAARALEKGRLLEPVYNLGSGAGTSVRQIVDAMREVTGIATAPVIGARRQGDPARIVASGELATRDLKWKTSFTVAQMVSTAWEAMPHA
ncbi:UDP-glucose 4-epimerase GalE [Demequina sp. TTPB684]|uniref:UDP-glucose 4-epimerase GalE n=1 Tax=unclassified Demequina TaxID=2620311 RepID=UPI001CF3DBAE|nr:MULTISPECIES: UDP-glucose 4-epimerase GalE [unclassified Demequina]MCB2413987.1 UDP-glucose 4-epimerase GalE [Demequina sp. TTPB684]UPU88661.1 UDP-glucose 4-epimerase GalE [Demequina sp. TMPB413]